MGDLGASASGPDPLQVPCPLQLRGSRGLVRLQRGVNEGEDAGAKVAVLETAADKQQDRLATMIMMINFRDFRNKIGWLR